MDVDEILFVAVFGVALIEVVLTLLWSRLYFTTGIPVLIQDFVVRHPSEIPAPTRIEDELPETRYPRLVFRDLGQRRYAFREKGFEWGKSGYSQVIRGLMQFSPEAGRVRVTGYLNWFTFFFGVTGAIVPVIWARGHPIGFVFPIALVALIAWIYKVQKKRFVEAGEIAADLWDRAVIPRSRRHIAN